jgi:predicted dehydrogenase
LRCAVRQAGVHFLPSEALPRLAEQHRQIKQWVDRGAFGRLVSVSATLWAGLPQRWPDDPDPGWWADPRRTPGGGWIDHAIYDVDLLRWLLGEEVVLAAGIAANQKFPACRSRTSAPPCSSSSAVPWPTWRSPGPRRSGVDGAP